VSCATAHGADDWLIACVLSQMSAPLQGLLKAGSSTQKEKGIKTFVSYFFLSFHMRLSLLLVNVPFLNVSSATSWEVQ
jgi:hypothetical protein